MDKETLTNHISHLGKEKFKVVCQILLKEVFNKIAIDVDGAFDGGTDFVAFSPDGERQKVAFQITTQKKQIASKAFKDAKKAISKLGSKSFYFLTTVNLSETQAIRLQQEINDELGIASTCLGAGHIAGLLLDARLLTTFLDAADYPLPRGSVSGPMTREMALHAYSLSSTEVVSMKDAIYDDTLLFLAPNSVEISEQELLAKAADFLQLLPPKERILKKRFDALLSRRKIVKSSGGGVRVEPEVSRDLEERRRIYTSELNSLAAAQAHLLKEELGINWSQKDVENVSVLIAKIFVYRQLQNLSEIKAPIVLHPMAEQTATGYSELTSYLVKHGIVVGDKVRTLADKLLDMAADHPLIVKLSRASVYVALEGSDPLRSAKALGASRWSECKILLEPSVAIYWVCKQLFNVGSISRFADTAVEAVTRAIELDSEVFTTYFFISEIASHLL